MSEWGEISDELLAGRIRDLDLVVRMFPLSPEATELHLLMAIRAGREHIRVLEIALQKATRERDGLREALMASGRTLGGDPP